MYYQSSRDSAPSSVCCWSRENKDFENLWQNGWLFLKKKDKKNCLNCRPKPNKQFIQKAGEPIKGQVCPKCLKFTHVHYRLSPAAPSSLLHFPFSIAHKLHSFVLLKILLISPYSSGKRVCVFLREIWKGCLFFLWFACLWVRKKKKKMMGSSSKGRCSNYDYSFKILLIGDSGVGKSSILLSYISNFVHDLSPTIGYLSLSLSLYACFWGFLYNCVFLETPDAILWVLLLF